MKKYIVELTAHLYVELELEAEDEEQAVERALDLADHEIQDEEIEWDVEYVEELDD